MSIIIPSIAELGQMVDKYGFFINENNDPAEEFEIYNEETNSGVTCMMTSEFELFSIDIHNPNEQLIEMLIEVLSAYNLPTSLLKPDVLRCFKDQGNFITEYSNYWVEYKPHQENVVLLRYREFVRE